MTHLEALYHERAHVANLGDVERLAAIDAEIRRAGGLPPIETTEDVAPERATPPKKTRR